MKKWVKPFIIQEFISSFSSLENLEEGKEKIIEQKTKELENDEVVYMELTNLLQCDFGDALGEETSAFTAIFGSVLADLPEDVFKKLCGMKNVFYIFTPFPGAEVKLFNLSDDTRERQIRIVNFPNDSLDMTQKALRGEIAHELAHILLGHSSGEDEMEDQADETVNSWGFEKELKALKDAQAEYYRDMLSEK